METPAPTTPPPTVPAAAGSAVGADERAAAPKALKTAVAMVTIGRDSWTRRFSVARAKAYAARHGYDFVQMNEPILRDSGRTPHWQKVLVPRAFPDYERWLIVDDDVLFNARTAPPVPELPAGHLGMTREWVPTRFEPPMEWLANSGVMLLDRAGVDLLEAAYTLGEYKDIVPGYGDQPALNAVAWRAGRVSELDWRWNYIPMADWLRTAHRQEYPWTNNVALARLARATFFLRLLAAHALSALRVPAVRGTMGRMREAYCVHLIWLRMGVRLVDHFLG